MNTRPSISDEEIRSRMNFDEVLKRHAAQPAHKNSWKWIAGGSAVVIAVATWFGINQSGPANVSHEPTPVAQNRGDSTDVAIVPVQPAEDKNKKMEASAEEPKVVTPSPEKTSPTQTAKDATHEIPASDVYVEAQPTNGYPSLYEYFRQELHYPDVALKDSTEGIVSVSFVIGRNGRPEQVTVVQSLGAAFDEEAKRVIMGMPQWQPATLNGKSVPAKVSMPLTFQIQRKATR